MTLDCLKCIMMIWRRRHSLTVTPPPEELAKLQELVALCERMSQQKAEFKR